MNLSGKRVLIFGSHGFLGKHLGQALLERGADIRGVSSADCDLRKPGDAMKTLEEVQPDLVVNCAARVGGILFNKTHPYTVGSDNLKIGLSVLDACVRFQIPKLVMVSSVCAYPAFPDSWPFEEESLWSGFPEESNASYGVAKRTLGTIAAAAVEEGNLPCAATVLLANLYGPGDNFDPENSHVIPAMIRKLCDAADRNLPEVEFWGSGKVSRDFLNVSDAARGITRVCEGWDVPAPINIATGKEVFLHELADMLAQICGFTGIIRWADQGLDGQRSRCLDTRKAWTALAWEPRIEFKAGLEQTVRWWIDKCASSQP